MATHHVTVTLGSGATPILTPSAGQSSKNVLEVQIESETGNRDRLRLRRVDPGGRRHRQSTRDSHRRVAPDQPRDHLLVRHRIAEVSCAVPHLG